MTSGISIVIPTLNEESNILSLVNRLDKTFRLYNLDYELIFIDDHSTDKTFETLLSLSNQYSISAYLKVGSKGKAQSLLEGFEKAKYRLIGMIDADLQYPPEAIPEMIKKINQGDDVVVANRLEGELSFKRRLLSQVFRQIFAKWLHRFDLDVQSGLKVFKKEIIQRITINPTPWTFDLEFLLKARSAGYKIGSITITSADRVYGRSKVHSIKGSYEIGLAAIKSKFRMDEIIPFHGDVVKREGYGFHFKGKKFIPHTQLPVEKTALFRLSFNQSLVMIGLGLLLLICLVINWHLTTVVFLGLLMMLYFIDLLFNSYLVLRNFYNNPEIKITQNELSSIPKSVWPTYTILCPLYKEWQMISQFVRAISQLDYPRHQLQVMLLLEEDDIESVVNVKKFDLPAYFEVIVVPASLPKTKPKACNYGLLKARGEYCVIYDAEDVPESDQLKKAVLAFKQVGPKIGCIQAKLNFYNPHHNLLTRLFTAEYSLWFDLTLTGLQSINAPIPLGGTSNHFRTEDLRQLQGWDAFNVTEDCDLGMRLVKNGFKTAIIDSVTHEEANSDFRNWLGQRSRWVKGYIQTYFVHMRTPQDFLNGESKLHLFTFQLIVGGKILSMIVNPILWLITASYFIFRPWIGNTIESFFPGPILYIGVFSAVLGNFFYFYNYMIACAKIGHYELIKYAFFIPGYWLMMSCATWIAVHKIITQPHYWFKTKHGLHLSNLNIHSPVEPSFS